MSTMDDDHARYYAYKRACDELLRAADAFIASTSARGDTPLRQDVADIAARLRRESDHVVSVWN